MILGLRKPCSQGWGVLFLLSVFCGACSPRAEILPPATSPLTRAVLGYGVISASYTRVMDEPSRDGVTLGYVREKTILTVLERRLVRNGDTLQYWLFTEGNYRGWLPEEVLVVYDNPEKAQTAAASR